MKRIRLCVICAVGLITVLSSCANTQKHSNDLHSLPDAESAVQKDETESGIADKSAIVAENEDDISVNTIEITVNGRAFTADLYDNETAKAFAELLPLTLDMSELHGNEKYFYLDNDLPVSPTDIRIVSAGDIMLYGSDCIVLFYESFETSYSYTKIGKIRNPAELAEALGGGKVTINFQIK